MTVKELKEILSMCNDDDVIVMSIDSEGNCYHPLSSDGVNTSDYNWDGEYNGEIGLRVLTPELELSGYTEDDILEDGTACVVFWP
jgi:hypothetical protein